MKTYISRLIDGRINRRTFIVGIAFYSWTVYLVGFVSSHGFIGGVLQQYPLLDLVYLPYVLITLLLIVSLYYRRLNDIDNKDVREGKNFTYKWRVLFLVFFIAGKKQENKYGKPPPPNIDFKGLFGF
jgi:uncharacterized membrane protein YhaH (DUF805 family)